MKEARSDDEWAELEMRTIKSLVSEYHHVAQNSGSVRECASSLRYLSKVCEHYANQLEEHYVSQKR